MNAQDWSIIIFAIGGIVSMILLSLKKVKQVDCCCGSACTQDTDEDKLKADIDLAIKSMQAVKYRVSPRVIFPKEKALNEVEERVDNIV